LPDFTVNIELSGLMTCLVVAQHEHNSNNLGFDHEGSIDLEGTQVLLLVACN